MTESKAAARVFSDWAKDDRAERMWRSHLPRVRQIWPEIPDSSGNYLEIGCGAGRGLMHVAEKQFRNGSCIGIDISDEMVALARKNNDGIPNVHVEKADFLAWRHPAGARFDTIFSMEVFYYFPSIQKGLDRAASMLAPGGLLLVLVDLYKENHESHDWSQKLGVPMQMWSRQQYAEGFTAAGLVNVRQTLLQDPAADPQSSFPTLCTYAVKQEKD